MKKFLGLCFAVSLFFVLSAEAQKKSTKFTTSGKFSDISLGSPTGDLGGTEVYLTESDGSMFALVTIAEGLVNEPVLVDAKMSGKDMRTVEFALPPDENGASRKFKGTVSAAGLKLNKNGDNALLKRSCLRGAKTYSNISVGKESGDYGGMEIYLTESDGDWYVLITIAEGVLLPPRLVKATVTGKMFDKIEFTLPDNRSGRKFTGTISSKAGGSLALNENGSRSVLKAKCYK